MRKRTRRRGLVFAFLMVATLVVAAPLAAQEDPGNFNDLLENGGFETGDLTGWVASDNTDELVDCQQDWNVNATGDTGCDEAGNLDTAREGTYAAYNSWEGDGPLAYTLEQTFTVPQGLRAADLSWWDTSVWDLVSACTDPSTGAVTCGPRQFYVDLLDPAGELIERLYTFEIDAGTAGDTPWTMHTVRLNTQIDPYLGQDLTVRFTNVVPESFTGPAGFGLDGVSIVPVRYWMCRDTIATIVGTPDPELIEGTEGPDVIVARDGDDIVNGNGGDDLLCGNAGDDIINGGLGNDGITGGDNADLIRGQAGDDLITGAAGDDVIYGNAGNDRIAGGDGNDTIEGGTGDDDLLRGGAGDDMMDGGEGNDFLRGNEGNDTIYGRAGDDEIEGKRGDDTIWAGIGNDEVRGQEGSDVVYGEEGNDELWGNELNDTLWGGEGDDEIRGGAGADTVSADAGADLVYGGQDTDTISGGDGPDTLWGQKGADTITGDAGDDFLDGGPEFDSLDGGPDTDECRNGEAVVNCEL